MKSFTLITKKYKEAMSFRNKWMLYIIACMFFGIGLFVNVVYMTYFKNENGSTSELLNPTLSFIATKDRIVDFQSLREYLTNTFEKRDDHMVSIYFEYLPTGANIAVNKDEKAWPASLIKIPIAMSVMKKVENNIWKLSNELVILDEDKDSEYGDMYKEPTGTTHTIQTFLEKTLIDSDNTAHFVLLRNLDGTELEDVYVHLGLDEIIEALKKSPKGEDEVDNRITAKRYSIFFRSLYNATYLDQKHSGLFLEILSNAPRDSLGKGIPSGVPFVHKTGIRIDEKVRADSGIVYAAGRPYILTVMIQQKKKGDFDQEEIDSIFEEISKEVYNHVTHSR